MNAPMMLRQQRLSRISQISALLKKLKEEDKPLKYDNIVQESMMVLGMSKKTMQEYVDAALYQMGISKEEIK